MNLNEVRNILLELRDKNPDLSNQIDEIISKNYCIGVVYR